MHNIPGSGLKTHKRRASRPESHTRYHICAAAIIFAVALAVRLIHIHFFRSTIFFTEPIFDEVFYHEQASRIAGGNWLGHKVHFMGPLYSYFLGILYSLSGGSRLFALVVQSVLGAGTCAVTFFIGREMFSLKVASIAGAVAALYGVLVFYDGLFLMETLTLFLNMLCLYLLIRGMKSGTTILFAAAGLCLGLSALGRASILLFGLGALLLVILRYPGQGRKRASAAVLFAVTIAAVVLPVTVGNFVIERDFTLVSANGGLNFYIGNGPGANGTFRILTDTGVAPGDMTGRFHAEIMAGRRLTMAETSRWWYGQTLDYISAHPWRFIRNFAWKVRLLWNSYEIPQIEWYDAARSSSPVLGLPLVSSILVIPLALLGIVAGARNVKKHPLLILYVAAQTLAFSLFFVTGRYRLSLLPALALLAAYGVAWLAGEVRRRHWRLVVISFAGLAAAFWLTAPGRLELNMKELEKWYSVNLGLRYSATAAGGEMGVELLGGVAQESPDDPDARLYNGIVLRRAGRYDGAISELEAAAALRPRDGVIPFQMGKTYAEMGQDSLAVKAFKQAIAIAPLYEDAYEHLAFAYSRMGLYEAAAAELEKAVEVNPTDSSLRLNLGVTYGLLGRTADALRELELAVRYDRSNWKARYNLAVALVDMGRIDEAREELRAILAAESDNEAALRALRELGGGADGVSQ